MSRSCSAEPSGMCRPLTIRLASRLTDVTPPVFASNTRTPTGEVSIQGLQVGPGSLLVPVPAGVGDDQRRLGGEHDQGLLVFGGELHILLAHVEGPDALPQVANGRGKKGKRRAHRHRRLKLRKAQGADVAVEVPQTQRLRNPAEVLEEHHPFGQVREPPVLLRSQPGGYKVLYLPRLIQQGDDAVARPGQGAGAVQHPLEHRVEVEALVDAQTGLAEAGQPVAQLRYLPRLIVCLFHFPPRIGLTTAMSRPSPPRRAGCGIRDANRSASPNCSWPRRNSQQIRRKKSLLSQLPHRRFGKTRWTTAHFSGDNHLALDRPVDGAMAQWPSPLGLGLGPMELREADDLSGGRQAAGATGRADLS